MKKWKFTSQGQVLVIGVILILAYKLINNFEDIWFAFCKVLATLGPFFAGILIAFFLYRPVRKVNGLLQRCRVRLVRRFSMAISTLSVYCVILFLLSLTVKFVIPIIYENIEDFVVHIPRYYTELTAFLEKHELFENLNLTQFINDNLIKKLNLSTLNQYIGLVSRVANYFLSAFMSIIFSIYIILEKDDIVSFFKRLFRVDDPTGHVAKAVEYIRKIINLFYSYFSGLFLDALIMGIASFLMLTCFQVPYAPLMGVITAVGNLIPFFGPIVSTVIIFTVSLLTIGPLRSIWVILALFVMAQLDSNVLQPKIISNSVGVSPLLVLLSVTVFGGLFGAAGMFLGVPVTATMKIVVNDILDDGRLNGSHPPQPEDET